MKGLLTTEGLWRALTRGKGLFLIAGPCVIESPRHPHEVAARVKAITARLRMPYVFKASYDKANRTSLTGKRGLGMDAGLKVLQAVKAMGMPVLTDFHEAGQAAEVASVVDVLQIPALLCRQTDLIKAVCKSGRLVNVKKGQFLAPHQVQPLVKKIEKFGAEGQSMRTGIEPVAGCTCPTVRFERCKQAP